MAINLVNDNISTIEIQNKKYNIKSVPFHGTEVEWESNNYIPKDGEIIIYDIDENYDYKRIKIGDGTTVVNDLPFQSNIIKQSDIDTSVNNLKNDLLNGAGAAYDTLKELGDLIDDNQDAIDALETVAAGKQNTITGAATTITGSNLTASRALISNSSGKVAVSAVTSTELGYLNGVTSNIQTQLDSLSSEIANLLTYEDWVFTLQDGSTMTKQIYTGSLSTENWTFTLENGSTVTKGVYVG